MEMFLKRIKMKKTFTLSLFLLLITLTGSAQKQVYAASYGLIPNTGKDCTPYLVKIFESIQNEPEVHLIISAGDYNFYEENAKHKIKVNSSLNQTIKSAIVLKNLQNIQIDGNFAQFIFHGDVQPFLIQNCKNIKIRNLFIDYATPTLAEGEVVNVKETFFTLKMDPLQFPYTIEHKQWKFKVGKHSYSPFGFVEFNTVHNMVEPYTGDRVWKNVNVEEDSMGYFRIYYDGKFQFPKMGNWIVMRHGTGDSPGFLILESEEIVIQNVNIYQTSGFAFHAQNCKNLAFYSCSVVPNTSNNRKYLSSQSGGFELIGCTGFLKMDNCETFSLMDDAVKVHGTYAKIIKIGQDKIRVRITKPQLKGIGWAKIGETIAFVDPKSMITFSTNRIRKIKQMNDGVYEITLENEIPETIKNGMVVENLSAYPDLFIQNSRFRSGRMRGLVINTSGKILVESNIFETSGSAILFGGDATKLFESGPVDQVLIRKNIFRYSCMSSIYDRCEAVISIFPDMEELESEFPYHANIRIENNNFFLFDYPILYAKSVDGIMFFNNTLYRSIEFSPFHPNKFGVKLVGCKNAIIGNNKEIGDILGKNVGVEQMDPAEVNKKD